MVNTVQVWASKWNERAYFNTRKVKLDHAYLSMAVLVQEIVSADYAFVIHTINPSSGDRSEIYAEVVKGLGETLVGAYPGRALSFVCNKDDLNSPKVDVSCQLALFHCLSKVKAELSPLGAHVTGIGLSKQANWSLHKAINHLSF
jgi:hypothetical protein